MSGQRKRRGFMIDIIGLEMEYAKSLGLPEKFISTQLLEDGMHWKVNGMITREDIERAFKGDREAEERVKYYALAYFENLMMILYARLQLPVYYEAVLKAREIYRNGSLKELLEFMKRCCGVEPL